MPMFCECCGKEGAAKTCSRCKEARYCSVACQRKHWKAGHKTKCVTADKTHKLSAAKMGPAPPRAANIATAQSGGGAGASGEECAICLDTVQEPQTMPCGHRFCRGCVDGMRQHGGASVQVCPLCRGPMPDAERMTQEAARMLTQHDAWRERHGLEQMPPRVQGLLAEAADLSRKALAVDPASAEALRQLAGAQEKAGDIHGALQTSRRFLDLFPGNALEHFNLGNMLGAIGDHSAALGHLRKAAKLDPEDHRAHCAIAQELEEMGDSAGAEASYRASLAIKPAVKVWVSLGSHLIRLRGDVDGAEAAFRQAVRHATVADLPRFCAAHGQLGVLLMHRRRDDEGAAACFCTAIGHNPHYIPSLTHLGCIKFEQQDFQAAEDLFLRALSIDVADHGTHSLESTRKEAFVMQGVAASNLARMMQHGLVSVHRHADAARAIASVNGQQRITATNAALQSNIAKGSAGFRETTVARSKEKPNDPCSCGSGKKFKKCCRGKM